MLGLLALLTALFLAYVVYLQTSVLLDPRRHSREMQVQRELADKAEASRFTELRAFLEAELRTLANHDAVEVRHFAEAGSTRSRSPVCAETVGEFDRGIHG